MRPNEIRQLTWPMLDRDNADLWVLNLDPKAAKIGKGRSVAVVGPLRAIVERRLRARRFGVPLIFHRTSKGKSGRPIKDYRLAWAAACEAAGLRAGRKVDGGLTPYDLRRSALRNLIRAGVHETIAMNRAPHALHLRPLQHRERRGHPRRGHEDRSLRRDAPYEPGTKWAQRRP
jgi:integrase